MTIGRIVLTHREDLIDMLKEYYLESGRTKFLVISYHPTLVDPKKFPEGKNFKLVPFFRPGEKDGSQSIDGQQFRAWVTAVKAYPEITHWVAHDYDVVSKVSDDEIFSRVNDTQFAMIGEPIPIWQEGMVEANVRTFPFPQKHKDWHMPPDALSQSVVKLMNRILMDAYPHYFQGIKTLLGGYGDIIATSSKNFLYLDDPILKNIKKGGGEQVPHTIFGAHGLSAVDLSKYYKVKMAYDNSYSSLDEPYDFIHPVKFWPKGQKAPPLLLFKNLVKKFLGLFRPARISYS
jgi:hypothetical protein